jgi:thioredoxin reductase/Pyruvate/2-oxoacid:ferredoxin oxidoreductase delta subunit
MRSAVSTREAAEREGSARPKLQHPVVDLSRCLGCATCIAACPEEGVLELVLGQALVVRGARCVGHSACERECPVGAITVTLTDLGERRDVPVLSEELEAAGSPGLFLAGEVTAHALIKTAVDQGKAVAAEVARRATPGLVADARELSTANEPPLDLCIVGAGPAGLACALEAKRLGLSFVLLDQALEAGGTVARYPRKKLVSTQPIDLPLHGRLRAKTYEKEELVSLWRRIVREQELPFHGGVVFEGLERDEDSTYLVHTRGGRLRASSVCLALGRRGVPNRLGVPGEELEKVAYDLLDARSHRERRVLVVGGGDSALETALGLADQPGNRVTLAARGEHFHRARARNVERLELARSSGRIEVLTRSRVQSIGPHAVELAIEDGVGTQTQSVPNDEVFVMAGGTAPIELLERSGVSFDPALRGPQEGPTEQGTGLLLALRLALVLTLLTLAWALWHLDYYRLPLAERPTHPKHGLLRPGLGAGLVFGMTATGLIVVNLMYLARRSPRVPLSLGSLSGWMTSHVATGILALLCATLHAAMAPRSTVGGQAFWALAVLLGTGAIGRYFYAWVPRAANGRELELSEVRARLERLSVEWDSGQQRYRERVRGEIDGLIEARQWRSSFAGRVLALLGLRRDLKRVLARLQAEGRHEGVSEEQIAATAALARRACRTASMTAHYEDLRAILGSWRWMHRWVAVLMVVLVVLHVVSALAFGTYDLGGMLGGGRP